MPAYRGHRGQVWGCGGVWAGMHGCLLYSQWMQSELLRLHCLAADSIRDLLKQAPRVVCVNETMSPSTDTAPLLCFSFSLTATYLRTYVHPFRLRFVSSGCQLSFSPSLQ